MQEFEQRDRELLGILQGEIPLVSTPFAVVGQKIDMSEKEVIKRTERMRREGAIRHLTAHFDTRALGYRSCLVAARVAEARVDEAAGVISAHPGVTQNYQRNHEFNLWFSIAVAPTSRLGLEGTVEVLAAEAGLEAYRLLPTVRLFKSSSADGTEMTGDMAESSTSSEPLSVNEVEAVRLLQRELPLQPRPFDVLAKQSAIGGEALITAARTLLARGQMRKLAVHLHQRKPGFMATAMGVWVVPEDRIDEIAAKLCQNRSVSHCYLRPTYPDWPYNIFTTVHGRSVDECESIINDLAIDTGVEEKRALFPTREYKKARLQYFSPDADAWEEPRLGRSAIAAS
jgi:DNA-binding Lrp family transcriptional regulator